MKSQNNNTVLPWFGLYNLWRLQREVCKSALQSITRNCGKLWWAQLIHCIFTALHTICHDWPPIWSSVTVATFINDFVPYAMLALHPQKFYETYSSKVYSNWFYTMFIALAACISSINQLSIIILIIKNFIVVLVQWT